MKGDALIGRVQFAKCSVTCRFKSKNKMDDVASIAADLVCGGRLFSLPSPSMCPGLTLGGGCFI